MEGLQVEHFRKAPCPTPPPPSPKLLTLPTKLHVHLKHLNTRAIYVVSETIVPVIILT